VSYVAGTVLARKVPFEEPEIDSGEADLTPYNEIVIIGPSPIQTNVRLGEWVGQQGDKISFKPTSFGEVLDRPQGELEQDYEVVSTPAKVRPLTHTVEVVEPGPSPESVFRADDDAAGRVKSDVRQETSLEAV
jgi:hypothetical protein